MNASTGVNLGLRLLDDQLIDAEDNRCGRVDDVELNGGPGRQTEVAALLVGTGSWPGRLSGPFSAFLAEVTRGFMYCIPWSAVADVSTTVRLSLRREDLGLGADDGRNVRWLHEPSEGRLRLTELLGSEVLDSFDRRLGRVREVRAERLTVGPDDPVSAPWRVVGLLLGWQGLQQRIGSTRREPREEDQSFVSWDRVTDLAPRVVKVSDQSLRVGEGR